MPGGSATVADSGAVIERDSPANPKGDASEPGRTASEPAGSPVVPVLNHGSSAWSGAGTGPGIDGVEENSGRASSRNENAGNAEEATGPKAPGTAGAGGCAKSIAGGSDFESIADASGVDASAAGRCSAVTNSMMGFASG